jgi:hypothetical protein
MHHHLQFLAQPHHLGVKVLYQIGVLLGNERAHALGCTFRLLEAMYFLSVSAGLSVMSQTAASQRGRAGRRSGPLPS